MKAGRPECQPDRTRWPSPGDKMKFLGKNGYSFELQHASQIFEVGQELTVEDCNVGNWSHSVKFVDVPGWFNGVMFERTSEVPLERSGGAT